MTDVAGKDVNRTKVLIATGNDSSRETLWLLVDTITRRLLVDAEAELQGHGAVGEDNGTVTAAGTAVQLTSHACKMVIIANHESNGDLTNGGLIVVGGSGVVAATGTRKGLPIYPSQVSIVLPVTNTNLLYVDSVDASAKFHYFYAN